MPPQTYSTCPVMKPARRSRNDDTACATSSGRPMRPTGMAASSATVLGSPGGLDWSNSSVAIGPGATVLTVMPALPSSSAQVRVMPTRPDLVAP